MVGNCAWEDFGRISSTNVRAEDTTPIIEFPSGFGLGLLKPAITFTPVLNINCLLLITLFTILPEVWVGFCILVLDYNILERTFGLRSEKEKLGDLGISVRLPFLLSGDS